MPEYKFDKSYLPKCAGYIYCYCSGATVAYFLGCSSMSKAESLLHVEIWFHRFIHWRMYHFPPRKSRKVFLFLWLHVVSWQLAGQTHHAGRHMSAGSFETAFSFKNSCIQVIFTICEHGFYLIYRTCTYFPGHDGMHHPREETSCLNNILMEGIWWLELNIMYTLCICPRLAAVSLSS